MDLCTSSLDRTNIFTFYTFSHFKRPLKQFKENLLRGKKYGGRSIKEIIYDTYINPKIETLSFQDIQNLFKKNIPAKFVFVL